MTINYVLHEKPLTSTMYLLVNAAEGESNRFKLELSFGDKVSFLGMINWNMGFKNSDTVGFIFNAN